MLRPTRPSDIGDTTLPRPRGPHQVGCTDLEFLSESGLPVLARLYYPTAAAYTAADRASWFPSAKYHAGYGYYLRMPTWLSAGLFRWLAGTVQSWALLNAAPLAAPAATLLVFSHGIGGFRTTYSVVCSELASRGLVVAAMEHRDGSAAMSVDGEGRVIEYLPPPRLGEYGFRCGQVGVRVEEIAALVRFMTGRIGTHGGVLRGNLDIVRALVSARPQIIGMGHSMGAATVFRACALFDRIVGLDPWMYPLPADLPVCPVPSIVVALENFSWPGNRQRIQDFAHRYYIVRKADHGDQSDVPVAMPEYVRRRMRNAGCVDPRLVLRVTLDLVLAFLDGGPGNGDYDGSVIVVK